MKVTAHIQVSKGYGRGIQCSQWIDELLESSEEYNQEHHSDGWLSKDRDRAVVTVTFEVPDSVFKRDPIAKLEGQILESNVLGDGSPDTNTQPTR